MAHVEKFTEGAVPNILRHGERQIENNSNPDIDPQLTKLNYSLLNRDVSCIEYFRQRKSELYCIDRQDVKVMAGWIVTLPQEISDPSKQREFFEATHDFLSLRYGAENVVQSVVHYDEGKREKVFDRWGNPVTDSSGKQVTQLVVGQPHLHFSFIPVTPDHKHGGEKICANDVLNRRELQHFHTDLQHYLNNAGINCKILTGVTAAHGRNRTVDELKERYEMQQEIARLRTEIERLHSMERERNRWN